MRQQTERKGTLNLPNGMNRSTRHGESLLIRIFISLMFDACAVPLEIIRLSDSVHLSLTRHTSCEMCNWMFRCKVTIDKRPHSRLHSSDKLFTVVRYSFSCDLFSKSTRFYSSFIQNNFQTVKSLFCFSFHCFSCPLSLSLTQRRQTLYAIKLRTFTKCCFTRSSSSFNWNFVSSLQFNSISLDFR